MKKVRTYTRLGLRHGVKRDKKIGLMDKEEFKAMGPERAKWYLDRGVNPQEAVFCESYYANGCNLRQAYITAGYETTPDPRHASSNARRLRHKPHIAAAIAERLAEVIVPHNEVIARVLSRLDYTMEDFLDIDDEGNHTINMKKAKDSGAIVVLKSIRPGQYGTSIEIRDNGDDLDRLAKILGVYKEEINVTAVEDPIAIFTKWTKTPAPDKPKS